MFSCLLQLTFLLRTNLTAKATNSIAKATNSIENGTNSIAKPMNSIANGTNSIAKATNSIANGTNSIAKSPNSIAKSPNSIAKTCNKQIPGQYTCCAYSTCINVFLVPRFFGVLVLINGPVGFAGHLVKSVH